MKIHLSISCLLVSLNFVFFVDCNFTESHTTFNDVNDESAKNHNGTNRWELEVEDFPSGLQIENDKGELVELTAVEIPPRGSASRTFGTSLLFKLFTRKNPKNCQLIMFNRYTLEDIRASNFDSQKPTIFITHGWITNADGPSCALIRDAYLASADVNVFIVDWGLIAFSSYPWAAKQVVRIGKQVAQMINLFRRNKLLDTKLVTLIGHSLGAHVMGIAGYNSDGAIDNIFGLDPAYPMFKHARPGARISRKDANYVQIIHTNAGLLGYPEAIGHADFYPNGGSSQSGCTFDIGGSCSHSRAFEFFAESVLAPNGFIGQRCPSSIDFLLHRCRGPPYALMGGAHPSSKPRGMFYLWTNSKPPYATNATI